jgi:hypothetical protein
LEELNQGKINRHSLHRLEPVIYTICVFPFVADFFLNSPGLSSDAQLQNDQDALINDKAPMLYLPEQNA